MAMPIRSFPILEGEVAERFLLEARKAEKNPRKKEYSEETRQAVRKANEDLRIYYALHDE